MDVIASTAFGIDVNSQKDPDNMFVAMAKKAFNVSFQSPFIMFARKFMYMCMCMLHWAPFDNCGTAKRKEEMCYTNNIVQ